MGLLDRLKQLVTRRKPPGRVLYVGQSYYNTWYLSQGLRARGWTAETLNTDETASDQIFYHGQDYQFRYRTYWDHAKQVAFFARAIVDYDVFHFSGMGSMSMLRFLNRPSFRKFLPESADTRLLKLLGKKIVYSNNGCHDGVTQTSFRKWGPEPICDICPWKDVPSICSDEKNAAWGRIRNELSDYQVLFGSNRADFNVDPSIHEVPEFYCLDPDFWNPDLPVPTNYQLPFPEGTVKIYHAVGNYNSRTAAANQRNLKSTHIYLPLIKQLKAEGHPVELIFFNDVPNKQLRFYQVQADIVVDMLTYGFFGANVREALMLGKPVVCYLRPEWVADLAKEMPEYAAELPIVNATPATVRDVLIDLITHPEKRREIGARSRAFAVKWHSTEAGGARFDRIYGELLGRR